MAIVQIVRMVRDRFAITCHSSPPAGDTKKPVTVSKVPVTALRYINFLFFVKKATRTRVP
jgi:hypothetical protein